jgi:phage-related protein
MAKKTKKKTKKKEVIVDPYVDPYAEKTKKPKAEKIKVVDISKPTTAELKLEIAALRSRIDRIVEAISKSKSVKGL